MANEKYLAAMNAGEDVVSKKTGRTGKRVKVGTLKFPEGFPKSGYFIDQEGDIYHTKWNTKLDPEEKAKRAKKRKAESEAKKAKISGVKSKLKDVRKLASSEARKGNDVSAYTKQIADLEGQILAIKNAE